MALAHEIADGVEARLRGEHPSGTGVGRPCLVSTLLPVRSSGYGRHSRRSLLALTRGGVRARRGRRLRGEVSSTRAPTRRSSRARPRRPGSTRRTSARSRGRTTSSTSAPTNPRDRPSAFANSSWIYPGAPTALDQAFVQPGQIGRFTFTITAPAVSDHDAVQRVLRARRRAARRGWRTTRRTGRPTASTSPTR